MTPISTFGVFHFNPRRDEMFKGLPTAIALIIGGMLGLPVLFLAAV